ncbi:hypothetical protein ACFO0M_10155 [Micromonospora mangrovi]|uniref:Siphovirus-type tail component C-terminal domain-containing protein n=2 Tax=Micromonospora TaxID=1873 RepID=A0AAU8HDT1_9ACTN
MPVYVGVISPPTTPAPEPTPTPAPAPQRPRDPGRFQLVWIGPDGTELQLTSDTELHFTLDGWSNVVGAAPIIIVAYPHPRGGTRVGHVQPQPRTMTLPVRVRADTHMELVGGWRDFVRPIVATRRLGPGKLRILRPDGSAREIECYYQGGIEGEPGQGWLYDTAVLSLYCPDPYWRDVTPESIPYAYAGAPVSYLSPYLTVSPTSVLGVATATNAGDVEAWPEWTIVGPATSVVATNHTTGESFTLTGTLTAGQVATITTDPPTVRGPGDAIWTGKLSWPGAVLWGLQPGLNDVEFAVAGAGAGTSITLSYVPRYETA